MVYAGGAKGGVAVDQSGNVYIPDRIQDVVREVNPSGDITTFAGTGTPGYNGDGIPATTAELSEPTDVAVDSAGKVYISDAGNNRIRMVAAQSNSLTWSGLAKTADWSEADNWVEQTTPEPGQTLIFPAGAARLTSVNDLPNMPVGAIEIGASYNLRGAAIALQGGVTVTAGVANIYNPIELDEPTGAGDNPLNASAGAWLKLDGPVYGANLENGVGLDGPGIVEFFNRYNYAGGTTLQAGSTLELDGKNITLGMGPLVVVGAPGATATLVAKNSPTLTNSLSLQGGTLNFVGHLDVKGAVTVTNNTVLNFPNPIPNDSNNLLFHSTFNGPGTLTVQGPGGLGLYGTLEAGSRVMAVGGESNIALDETTNGSGSIIVNGGDLLALQQNTFTGSIEVQKGTITLVGPEALGNATLTVDPPGASDTVAIKAYGTSTGTATLNNVVNLNGGKLAVSGDLAFGVKGTVNLQQNSEIDPSAGALVTLAHGVALDTKAPPGSTLILGGDGAVLLGGTLTPAVTVAGKVQLASTFNGTGSLTVNSDAGELFSSGVGTTAAPYDGTVTLQRGTIKLGGVNPLGTGELDLGNNTQVVTLQLIAGDVTLGNKTVNLNGGTVALGTQGNASGISGFLLSAPEVTVTAKTEIFSAGTAGLALTGVVNGTTATPLTVAAPVALAGTLHASVDIVAGGLLELLDPFGGDGGITLDGGILRSDRSESTSLNPFTGAITLNAGKIIVGATKPGSANPDGNADLGTGNLTVNVTAGQTAQISSQKATNTLANPLTLNGGTLTTSGALTLTGAVTLRSGTLDTQGQLTIAGPGPLNINGGKFGTKGTTVVSAPVTFYNGGSASAPILSASAKYLFTGTVTVQTDQLFLAGRDIFTGTLTLTQDTNFVMVPTTHASVVGPVTGGQTLTVSALIPHGLWVVSGDNYGTTHLIAGSGMIVWLLNGFTGDALSIGVAGNPVGIVLDKRTHPH